jgi:hypothetical protein
MDSPFFWVMVLSRWSPCEGLTHIAWEINGPSVSTESHSILNEYSQLDQQEAVVFGEWSLKDQSHKEEANRQTCSKNNS